MTVQNDLAKVQQILLRMQNYNSKALSTELLYWIKDLEYFYNTLVPSQAQTKIESDGSSRKVNNPSKTYYNISPASARPTAGQVAYFNLRRGYPKEVYDGHFCYILKDFKTKYIVIPTTSVKPNSAPMNPTFEIDITIKDFINTDPTRLQVSDIRSVDIQRINIRKNVYNVADDVATLNNKIYALL
ncbi:hypothetical protein BK126_15040 [Paenibacillus sp. FSL H7-0326]|uniref:hypothetical protein n=1 Tax=Paenibacillus sp. FSL H7-0326 TaxID=1921144 RepID=UPI00096BDE8F|nr:hypothetical protein [Paenibacillus sp. FSL H7-0326]OMC69089.1 hypothetical protein BK126_15040 [Paenibacillus sp. FSL H7-0326]